MEAAMPTIAAITLSTPGMLAGLAMLAIPVIAHLLNRRIRRPVVFPSIAILLAAAATQAKLQRWRRWLLLALRCIIVTLIVMAFTRPVWHGPVPQLFAQGKQTDNVVIVVDSSASMAQHVTGLSAMQMVQAQARKTLDSLAPGASANVIIAGGTIAPAATSMTSDRSSLDAALLAARPSAGATDLAAALNMAANMLSTAAGTGEVVVLSDMQANAWRDLPARLREGEALPPDVRLTVPAPEWQEVANIAVSDPVIRPHAPIVGERMQVIVRVTNFSPNARDVRVDLTSPAATLGTQSANVRAWQSRQMAFDVSMDTPGDHLLSAAIADDGFTSDNRVHVVARVGGRIAVVVVGDDDPDEPGTASFYLHRAIAPGGPRSRCAVTHLRSEEIAFERIADASVVFVVGVSRLTRQGVAALHQYVTQGGGLVWLDAGEHASANMAALDGVRPASLLPWELGPARSGAFTLATGDFTSPILRDFDVAAREALARIPLRMSHRIHAVHPAAMVLLRFSDGTPALVQRTVGVGTLVAANFGVAADAGDIGRHGAIVVLTQSMIDALRPHAARRQDVTVGHPVQFRVAGSEPVRVIAPDGSEVSDFSTIVTPTHADIIIPRTHATGFYRVEQAGRMVTAVAVNADIRESDLRRTDSVAAAATVGDSMRRDKPIAVTAATTSGGDDDTGAAIWGWCLLLAIVVMGLEAVFGTRWRR